MAIPTSTQNDKIRLCIQYDDHPRVMSSVLCTMLEHQSLVDIAIRCGNNTMHAHKCILAANSPYFREQLEANPATEQIIMNGMDYMNLKSLIEFIYCGETTILESNLKYLVAAGRLFQIRGLQALGMTEEMVYIQPPIFINEKAKYCSGFGPFALGMPKDPLQSSHQDPNLSSFCSIENEESYLSSIGQPLETIDYSELNNSMIPTPVIINPEESTCDVPDKRPEEKSKEDYNTNDGQDRKIDSNDRQSNVDLISTGMYVQVAENILGNIGQEDPLNFPAFEQNASSENKVKDTEQENAGKFTAFEPFIRQPFTEVDPNEEDDVNFDTLLLNMQKEKEFENHSMDMPDISGHEEKRPNKTLPDVPSLSHINTPNDMLPIPNVPPIIPKENDIPPNNSQDMNMSFYEKIMFEAASYFAEAGFSHLKDNNNEIGNANKPVVAIPETPPSPNRHSDNSEDEDDI